MSTDEILWKNTKEFVFMPTVDTMTHGPGNPGEESRGLNDSLHGEA